MTIHIGPVRIENPVILAPMSGVTDQPFRRLVKRNGAALVVSEMIASQAAIRETRQSLKMSTNYPQRPLNSTAPVPGIRHRRLFPSERPLRRRISIEFGGRCG